MKAKKIITVFLCGIMLLGGVVFVLNSADTSRFTAAQAAAEARSVRLPVIMYHKVLNNSKGSYTVSAKQLEDDIIALKRAGYVTVFPSQVIAFAKGKGTMPSKPIMLTFDDGHYNNMHYALPILKRHNQKAVINIIGAFSNHSTVSGDHSNPNYSHLTWEQIKELAQSGHFEIGNHTYNMHQYKPRFGIAQVSGEADNDYRKNITQDILRLQNILRQKSGVSCQVFAYPFGKYSQTGKEVLVSLGFDMLLTCNEGVNHITAGNTQSLLSLRRYNRDPSYSAAQLLNKIAQ